MNTYPCQDTHIPGRTCSATKVVVRPTPARFAVNYDRHAPGDHFDVASSGYFFGSIAHEASLGTRDAKWQTVTTAGLTTMIAGSRPNSQRSSPIQSQATVVLHSNRRSPGQPSGSAAFDRPQGRLSPSLQLRPQSTEPVSPRSSANSPAYSLLHLAQGKEKAGQYGNPSSQLTNISVHRLAGHGVLRATSRRQCTESRPRPNLRALLGSLLLFRRGNAQKLPGQQREERLLRQANVTRDGDTGQVTTPR